MFPTADTANISQVTSKPKESETDSDARNSTGNSELVTPRNRELTVNMLFKEIVFCIALALTTFGALHNAPTKISKHPQAIRFFKSDSFVKDWYKGQLNKALASIMKEDVSFVMYYAPWDAESQYVRDEFDKAATILKDRVHFAAINCWNPGSECRLQNNKIPSWPILIVYTVISRGILYKGPRDAHSMVNFLELQMKPMKRVSSSEDLVNLLSYCDVVAVGFTPLGETSKHYNVWYTVAVKIREADTIGEVCFAVVTSEELAVDLGVDIVPNARLMLWNETKEYITRSGEVRSWNDSSLIQWVLEKFSQPVARIIPMWRKAFNFARFADGNPILVLFTPLNPLHEQLPFYSLLREVAMEYYNCKNNDSGQWTTELTKLHRLQRILYQQKNFTRFCHEFKFKRPVIKLNRLHKKEVVSRNNKYPWTNLTERNQKNGGFSDLLKRGVVLSKGYVTEGAGGGPLLLSPLDWLQAGSAPAGRSQIETTMLPLEDDPLSPENLIQDSVRHFCKVMKFADERGPPAHPPLLEPDDAPDVKGLACARNFTLHMLALDSVGNHHFAESLGVDVRTRSDMTAVVILDTQQESQYVLSEEFNDKTIRDFIYKFTHKSLKRALRSRVPEAAHTHYFGAAGLRAQGGGGQDAHIEDLTTRSFRQMVRTPGVLTVVCVCGGACGAGATRALAEARRVLAACGVPLRAARFDALRHDLPAHYSPPAYPALLAFPARRRGAADSRSYPGGARVSAAGVVALALRALPPPGRLRARLALCAAVRGIVERRTCLKDMRAHVTSVIGRNLKYWRQAAGGEPRDAILRRLQHLHRVSFELSLFHVTEFNANGTSPSALARAIGALPEHWHVRDPPAGPRAAPAPPTS